MRWFKVLLLVLALGFTSCESLKPTPLLIGDLVEKNNEVITLYAACSEGANYIIEKEGCDSELLEQKAKQTMDFSKVFISSDIKQPQGYDVYLETVMIYFRIARRTENEYSEAELIARQFFEVQKAYSGKSINAARYHWAVTAAAHASWQWQYDELALDADRKTELLACLSEGRRSQYSLDGPRVIRLVQALEVLQAIIDTIE